jgi:hypothetical protein
MGRCGSGGVEESALPTSQPYSTVVTPAWRARIGRGEGAGVRKLESGCAAGVRGRPRGVGTTTEWQLHERGLRAAHGRPSCAATAAAPAAT